MSAIASPEFISLCRAQLQLLSQQLCESSSALYIVDVSEGAEGDRALSNYVPVVSYPEPVDSWVDNFSKATNWAQQASSNTLALPSATGSREKTSATGSEGSSAPNRQKSAGLPEDLPEELPEDLPEVEIAYQDASYKDPSKNTPETDLPGTGPPETNPSEKENASYTKPFDESAYASGDAFGWPPILRPDQQLIVPLVYTEVVVGLLISVRGDRAWKSEEQQHIEAVAQSLAAGCVLERRNQWLQTQLSNKRGLQSRQSEVFHNLLHQFRNPLTAVSTFGKLMVKRLEPEDPNRPIATGIVRESKRLRELVTHFDEAVALGDADLAAETSSTPLLPAAQALLSPSINQVSSDVPFSAAKTGDQPAAISEVGAGFGQPLVLSAQYLPDIVEPILAVANLVAAEKGVDLHHQVAADTPVVWGEEEALGEVISNLIDNAIKYSPPGARVWVQTGVSRTEAPVEEGLDNHYQGVIVADTGPGIPAVDQSRLFERNYRGVQAQSDIPGTGLGLAIARSLAQEMQGAIEVVSPAAGTPWLPPQVIDQAINHGPGTAFIVWLLEKG